MPIGDSEKGDEAKKMRKPNDIPPHMKKYFSGSYGAVNDRNLVYGANPQDAEELVKAQAALASETQTNLRQGSGLYIESYALPTTQEDVSMYTVSSDTVDTDDALQKNVTPDRSTGRIKLGGMYMELSGGSELAEIDLDIKGDPYWLGMSNLTKQFRNANTGIADFAIYEQGANLFWLNVRSPVEPDENTGKMEFVDNTTISGIFKVKSVISRFTNGAFTQTLTAIRDLGTNYEKARPTLLKFTNEEAEEMKRKAAIAAKPPATSNTVAEKEDEASSFLDSNPQPIENVRSPSGPVGR